MNKEHPTIKYSKALNIRGTNIKIDVIREWDETKGKYIDYTNDLKYGDKMEIIWDSDKQCYTIKSLKRIREEWNTEHGISNDPLDRFLEGYVE